MINFGNITQNDFLGLGCCAGATFTAYGVETAGCKLEKIANACDKKVLRTAGSIFARLSQAVGQGVGFVSGLATCGMALVCFTDLILD